MLRYQYPRLSKRKREFLNKYDNSLLLETLMAVPSLMRNYMSAFKRGIRAMGDKHNNIAFTGHIELPEDFKFDKKLAKPRGTQIGDVAFSEFYQKDFLELPTDIQDLILSFKGIVESYFACDANLYKANIWRNFNFPADYNMEELGEIYANAFHQDQVVDQYNIQLFILLQDVNEEEGPFEYFDADNITSEDMKFYRRRNKQEARKESIKLTGKRGDFMLFNTGSIMHKAGIPKEGLHRDIFSIAFFPSYTKLGTPISELATTRKNQ